MFGRASIVMYVFILATWAWTWIVFFRAIRYRVQRLSELALRAPGSTYLVAAFWLVIIAVSQAAFLALSNLIAAHLGTALRELPGPAEVRIGGWLSVDASSSTHDILFWMWFAGAVLIIASGWWSALHDGQLTIMHPVGWLLFVCGLMAGLVLIQINVQLSVLAFVYVLSGACAQYLPERAAGSWRRIFVEPVSPIARPDSSW
jgi:hypothetical protein